MSSVTNLVKHFFKTILKKHQKNSVNFENTEAKLTIQKLVSKTTNSLHIINLPPPTQTVNK